MLPPFYSRVARWLAAFSLVTLVGILAACGGSSSDDEDESVAPTGLLPTTTSAERPVTDTPQATSAGASAAAPNDQTSASAAPFDQLVIRTSQLTLRVTNVGDALGWVRSVAGARGGFVFASSSYVQDESQFASVTIKVPSASFDDTMNELRSGSLVDSVEREETTSQDVSAEFIDNESLLASLRETQTRFLALLAKAETVDDILRLEYELSNVRSQIETIQGRQNYLKDQTTFATIGVSLYPAGAAEPKVADDGFEAGSILSKAWDRSRDIVQDVLTVTVTLLILAATFAPFALAGWLVLRFIRRRRTAPPVGEAA